jgi:cytochrome P450
LNDFLAPVVGNRLGIAARHGTIRWFAANQVEKCNGKTGGSDLLSDLYDALAQKSQEMNAMAVLSMATSDIFADSGTTTISLRSTIYHLLKNPDTKKRLLEEIDDRAWEGKLPDPAKLEEADNMLYLQACMYEAPRLHPAVGKSIPRVV